MLHNSRSGKYTNCTKMVNCQNIHIVSTIRHLTNCLVILSVSDGQLVDGRSLAPLARYRRFSLLKCESYPDDPRVAIAGSGSLGVVRKPWSWHVIS